MRAAAAEAAAVAAQRSELAGVAEGLAMERGQLLTLAGQLTDRSEALDARDRKLQAAFADAESLREQVRAAS